MMGHRFHDVPFPGPVLHELAGQLHGIPFHTRDARDRQRVHLREHVVQAVAELVEERGHVVVGEQGGLTVDRRLEVAHQIGHRCLHDAAFLVLAAAAVVHPGARLLGLARVQVQIELAHQPVARADAIEAHVRMPALGVVLGDRHPEEPLDQPEETVQHAGQRKVLLHLVVRERIAHLLEGLAGVGDVPGLQFRQSQFLGRKGAQFGQIALGEGAGTLRQVPQELLHLGRGVRHLRHKRQLGVAGQAQQLCLLLAQRQDLLDQRSVVLRAAFGRPGGIGTVERLAQAAVVRILDDREVRRELQREAPARLALPFGIGPGGCNGIVGQARQTRLAFLRIGHQQLEGIGGVQHVFRELLLQRGQLFLDGGKALARRRDQLGAAQPEVAQLVLDGRLAGGIQRLMGRAGAECAVLLEERLILPHPGPELHHARQVLIEGLAQFGRVHDRIQVLHDAPGVSKAFGGMLQRQHEVLPGGGRVCRRGLGQRLLGVGQQHIQRRPHMLGLHGGEAGQSARAVQQRVVRGGGVCRRLCSTGSRSGHGKKKEGIEESLKE